MDILTTVPEMQAWSRAQRTAGRQVGFVPTMGALHAGHLRLLEVARANADRVVASIFVNPTQFGPAEDFSRYPRPTETDLALCRDHGCAAVFLPSVEAIYPPGDQTIIEVTQLSQPLCGAFRPNHFRGVATVVYKLFRAVEPGVACFGEKDYQQLRVIQQMVRDLDLPIAILPVPTIREPDGLALSSRNQYLSPAERAQALALPRALQAAQKAAQQGAAVATLCADVTAALHDAGITQIDYVALVDAETLQPATTLARPTRLCAALRIGTTRLIDNVAVDTTTR